MSEQLYSFKFYRGKDSMEAVFICYARDYHEAEEKAKETLEVWNRANRGNEFTGFSPEWRDKTALDRGEVLFVG